MRRGTARDVRRARELLVNVRLAVSTVAGLLGEDPLLAVLLASRRLPPGAVRAVVAVLDRGDGGGVGARAVLGAWLSGQDEAAVAALRRTLSPRGPRRVLRRGPRAVLLGELAVQLREEELADLVLPRRSPRSRARGRWVAGEMSSAVAVLTGTAGGLGARMSGHLAVLAPGARLDAGPASAPRQAGPRAGSPPVALHVLTNSLPHTQSGYSLRTHSVLLAQRRAGVVVAAVTRVGYPVTVGRLTARHLDVVDEVAYRRLAPARLARTPEARLQQQVRLAVPVLREVRPTVLHTTTDCTNAMVTEALARGAGLPWVYEVRGLLEETWVASWPTSTQASVASTERYRLLRAKETEMAVSADHVVTLSRTLRDELVARGVSGADITVVPNGVDPAMLEATSSAAGARAELGLAAGGLWVGTVSSIVDYEGLDTLVDAVSLLRGGGIDARLLVVGDGVARPALERRVREMGIEGCTVLTGRVPQAEAAAYHRALDVFVVPRRDVRVCRHVSPLKPVEAMASGRPVVASDLPALAELVAEPGSGLLVPPGDAQALAAALARLQDDASLRTRLGEAGRRFAAGRTWDRAGRTYRALYEGLAP